MALPSRHADSPLENQPTAANHSPLRPGVGPSPRANPRPLPSIPGSSRSHTPLTVRASSSNLRELPSSQPVFGSVIRPYDDPPTSASRPVNPRQPSPGLRTARQEAVDDPFDKIDVAGKPDGAMQPRFAKGVYVNVRPLTENATARVQALGVPERDFLAPDRRSSPRSSPPSYTRLPLPTDPPPSPPYITTLAASQSRLELPDLSHERFFNQQQTAGPSRASSTPPQFQPNNVTSDRPTLSSREYRSPRPPPRELPSVHVQEPQLHVHPPADEPDEWIEIPQRSGMGSGRPSPVDQSFGSYQDSLGDSMSMAGESQRSSQKDGPPRRGKEIRKGYYRLYAPSGTLFSVNPIYANDVSLSSFDVEHVPPPRRARNYIAFISQRECIKPSAVKMYLSRSGASPELVSNLDTVINMELEPKNELPGRNYPPPDALTSLPYRNLDGELPCAFYRLFGVASSSKGGQRPMPSHYPRYEDDPSITTFFVDYVPPPLRVKDYIGYIGEQEGIHPSRITLYLRAKSVDGEILVSAEAQEVKNVEDILTAKTASFTSEKEPILVNVELDVDEDGSLQFGMKSTPLPRLSIKVITRKLSRRLSKWQLKGDTNVY
ncbi:hypothetical protein FRC04_007094 [Tulasnella sp. 424]|nr:hypothetical protein FRC04_007094 [Tulasnella sp. 424]